MKRTWVIMIFSAAFLIACQPSAGDINSALLSLHNLPTQRTHRTPPKHPIRLSRPFQPPHLPLSLILAK